MSMYGISRGVIEDDLSASPVQLRAEIRRLRALLPVVYRTDEAEYVPTSRDEAIGVMSRHLCMLRGAPEGTACACPGVCTNHAEEIMNDLEGEGLSIVRLSSPIPSA